MRGSELKYAYRSGMDISRCSSGKMGGAGPLGTAFVALLLWGQLAGAQEAPKTWSRTSDMSSRTTGRHFTAMEPCFLREGHRSCRSCRHGPGQLSQFLVTT